jgi:23S rRNA pseudouridine1911/1915/1917 synthase
MQIDGISRSYAQKLIKSGEVTLNGNLAKNSDIAQQGDVIFVNLPELEVLEAKPENIQLDIVYEDDELLVINKPKGMVVHPAAGHNSGTLVNAILAHCDGRLSGINGVSRPGIVHRIDRDTTGLLIVAKTDSAHLSLARQISERSLVRGYMALVTGNIKEPGTVDAPIGRHPKNRKEMAVVAGGSNRPGGRTAVTHYKPIEYFSFRGCSYTLVECRLETGRTHQIRVHMKHIGHPISCDSVYGAKKEPLSSKSNGQLLHAYLIGFIHPITGEYLKFLAPLPDYFQDILEKLK